MNQLLQTLAEGQTPSDYQRRVLDIYSRVLPEQRRYLTWILSKTTMEILSGHELKEEETVGAYMCSLPVRRDDSVWGIGYEVLQK